MKGDENLAEVQFSRDPFAASTDGRVAGRVTGECEAFDPAGAVPDETLRLRRGDACETTSRRKFATLRELTEPHVEAGWHPAVD